MRVLKQWEQEEDTISACRLVLSACKLTDTDLEALSRICGESIFARSRADALRLQPNFAPGPPDAGCWFSLSAHNLTPPPPPPPVRLERPPWLGLLCVSTDTFSSTVLLIDKGHEQRTYQFLFLPSSSLSLPRLPRFSRRAQSSRCLGLGPLHGSPCIWRIGDGQYGRYWGSSARPCLSFGVSRPSPCSLWFRGNRRPLALQRWACVARGGIMPRSALLALHRLSLQVPGLWIACALHPPTCL